MYNLSLTACSFHLRKTNSKGNLHIYNLNKPATLVSNNDITYTFNDMTVPFISFFKYHQRFMKDDKKKQSFQVDFSDDNIVETEEYRMIYAKIHSGYFGSSSEIIDGNTEEVTYQKRASDIDAHPFYLAIVFPKDNGDIIVQKGMLLFQNNGPLGVKTITTSLMQEYFSANFNITLKCNTISPGLFVKKILQPEKIKNIIMIKNMKSSDTADNIHRGYGSEIRTLGNLHFSASHWSTLLDKMRFFAGGRFNLFEFEDIEYDSLKVVAQVGGRDRTINLHTINNLSIIESIPDEIQMIDGHPDPILLINHLKTVTSEYLSEMVLIVA